MDKREQKEKFEFSKSVGSPSYKSSGESSKLEKKLEDKEILKFLKSHDQKGVELLIQKYQDKLFAVVNRICNNPADSEEVLQDVFMTAYQKIDSFEERSSLSTWLYRIAVNGALMRLRRVRNKYTVVSMDDVGEGVIGDNNIGQANELQQSPADKLMKKELFDQVATSVSYLPEIYQEVFYCRDIQGYSIKETGEMLHTTPAAIKSRLHRSRLFLKEGLEPYLYSN